MSSWPNVTVCGCGSGGMAMAADLALLGCRVNLYEVPEFKANLEPIRANGGIQLSGRSFSGKTGLARFNAITSDAIDALAGSDVIFINVPAMAVGPFLEQLAPHFSAGQVVVVTTSYWASFRFSELLKATGAFDKYVFAEMSIMPYLSSKSGPAEAHIGNYKRELRIAAWPAASNERALAKVSQIYPQTKLVKNVLELNFWPGNPGVHPQVTLPNAAFFFDRARVFRFYGEVSMSAARLTDAHDVERMRTAAAYECESITWPEYCRRVYHYKGNNLYELSITPTDPHSQKWNQVEEIERLLVEDICYSFVPMEELARVAGLEMPVTRGMTDVLAVITGYDYRAHGIKLKDMGLDGLSREQIIEFAMSGRRE